MDYIRDYNIEREFFDKLNFRIYSETQGDITLYSCPECNDGKSFGRKHRCHWKYDNDKSFIHCFNCGFALGFESFILKYLGKDEYKKLKDDRQFHENFESLLKNYVGRETPLYYAKNF